MKIRLFFVRVDWQFSLKANPFIYFCHFFTITGVGGSPTATFFSCLAKKRTQKKAAEASCPCGVPVCALQKMGRTENSPAAQTSVLLFPFSVTHKRHRHIGTTKVKDKPNFKNNGNTTTKEILPNLFDQLGYVVDVAFDAPPLEM